MKDETTEIGDRGECWLWIVADVIGVAAVAVVEISDARVSLLLLLFSNPRWICEKIFPLACASCGC